MFLQAAPATAPRFAKAHSSAGEFSNISASLTSPPSNYHCFLTFLRTGSRGVCREKHFSPSPEAEPLSRCRHIASSLMRLWKAGISDAPARSEAEPLSRVLSATSFVSAKALAFASSDGSTDGEFTLPELKRPFTTVDGPALRHCSG